MKSFKKREISSGITNHGTTPTYEVKVHGTFDIPIEKCVMSPTNKAWMFCSTTHSALSNISPCAHMLIAILHKFLCILNCFWPNVQCD